MPLDEAVLQRCRLQHQANDFSLESRVRMRKSLWMLPVAVFLAGLAMPCGGTDGFAESRRSCRPGGVEAGVE